MRALLILAPVVLGAVALTAFARHSEPFATELYLPRDTEARHEFLQGPLGNTNVALNEVAAHVRALPAATIEPVLDLASFVAKTCPYNGAMIEVFQVLNTTLQRAGRSDLGTATEIVANHYKLLEQLDVTTRNGLDYSDAPSLTKYLGTVREQVDALTPAQRDAIAKAVAAVDVPTGSLWLSRSSLIRVRNELRDVAAPDPTMCASDLSDAVLLLDALIALLSC